MAVSIEILNKYLSGYPHSLLESIAEHGEIVSFPAQTGLMKQGQYVRSVPIVLSGILKVFTQYEDKELLLYYIKPSESCVMSFTAVINNNSSQIYAVTEEDAEILLLPSDQLLNWLREYPVLGNMYHKQYYLRYNDLLETIQQLLFEQLDQRLLRYLREKATIRQTSHLQLLHREIAADLGSSREVITCTLRRLEKEGAIRVTDAGIEFP